jgi:cytochrome c-type biogenesis protein CcmH/NrfG
MLFGKGQQNQFATWSLSLRLALALLGVAVCSWGIWTSWRCGASRLLTYHSRIEGLLAQSDNATNMTPDDPEAHSVRASVLLNLNELDGALAEYERAVALRPKDYLLWLELGRGA